MNHIDARPRPADRGGRPITRRAQAKIETRDKVLQAAKRLFIGRGFDAATIRDIAAEAGMSTGAVFANFTDKHDLFQAVLRADLEAQTSSVAGLVDHPGPVEAALGEVFATGYRIQSDQLPLIQAAISRSWTAGLEGGFGERLQCDTAVALVNAILDKAVERGDLAAGSDTRLIAEMLWDAYIANYRRALFDGWGADRLTERLAGQIAVIVGGARVRARGQA